MADSPDWFGGSTPKRSSGGGGSWFPSQPKPKKKKGHSFWHDIAEPFANAGKAVYGIGPGIYTAGRAVGQDVVGTVFNAAAAAGGQPAYHVHTGQTYEKVVKPTGQAYAHKYGPLFAHGDLGKTLHRALVEDPLGTILDLGTIATLGAGSAANVGLLREAPRSVVIRSPGARAGQEGAAVVERGVPGTQLSRSLRVGANQAMNRLPPEFAVLGENARYARSVAAQGRRAEAGAKLVMAPYVRAASKLSEREFVASTIRHDLPGLKFVDEYAASLEGVPGAETTLNVLRDPKVRELIKNPKPSMLRFEEESRKLGDVNAGLAGVRPETAEARRFQQLLIMRGAQPVASSELVSAMKAGSRQLRGISGRADQLARQAEAALRVRAKTREVAEQLTGIREMFEAENERLAVMLERGFVTKPQATRVGSIRMMEEEYKPLIDQQARVEKLAEAYEDAVRQSQKFAAASERGAEVASAQKALGEELAAVRAELERMGEQLESGFSLIPVEGQTIPSMIENVRAELAATGAPEPIYRPHKSVVEKKGGGFKGGGSAPQPKKAPGARHQSQGVLAAMGRVAYGTDTLTPAYLQNVKHLLYTDRHAELLQAGVRADPGYTLQPGERFLKTKRGEKIPYMEETKSAFEEHVREGLGDELVTKDPHDAYLNPDGTRVVIPEKVVNRIVGDYTRSNHAIARFYRDFTNVWRALVLNLRVGWLVNNVVGNSLLYAVKTAGTGGLRDFVKAIADIHGPDAALKMIDDAKVLNRLTPKDLAEVLPEQLAGTFFGTQLPEAGKFTRSAVGRKVTAIPRVLRHADIAYEQALRRALANNIVRRSPEVKARLSAMPKETRNFRAAAKQELASNPALADRVSREINNALGDFTNLSPIEQGALRSLIPFYAWYRAITLVMAKMPLDNPLRSNILYNLGKVGMLNQEDFGKPYLSGGIGLGSFLGPNAVLRTSGFNPYATLPQIAGNARTLAQASLGEIKPLGIPKTEGSDVAWAAGLFNPLIGLPVTGGLSRDVQYLPETRLLFPPGSNNYSDAGYLAEAFQYAGVPIRHVRPEKRKKSKAKSNDWFSK